MATVKGESGQKKLKKSEARILLFLEQADKSLCYKTKISSSLNIVYNYVCQTMAQMEKKGWIFKEAKKNNKVFYGLREQAPLSSARTVKGEW